VVTAHKVPATMTPRNGLAEPLLPKEDKKEIRIDNNETDEEDPQFAGSNNLPHADESPSDDDAADESTQNVVEGFNVRQEMWEMASLGLPLAVSFFCRMGMASTDSSFVGHINDGGYTPETYLAAAVLSDMCVNCFMVPPLAFNQVLNALVGQAVGSGNPKMAGIWLQQSMFWLALTMLPCLAGCFYVEPILKALAFPSDVAHVAGTYAMYNVIWPIPNGLYQCMRFYFQAQGLPNPAMYNNIVFLFVNVLLNYVFVFGGPFRYFAFFNYWKGLGFIGAAISLSISRTMQPIVYFCYMFLYKKHHLATWPDAGLSWKHHTRARTLEFMKQTVPNMGTLLFQQCASQATTVFVGRLGERAIAASSALSTVTIPWSGTLSASTCTISGVRVGYHLGRGNGDAARQSAWLVIHFITVMNIVMVAVFLPLRNMILRIATDDADVLSLGETLIPAMLVGTYLNLIVSNITSGVFSGMGRPIIATILSFGLELPMSIGGVALYIIKFHGDLIGVYWWQALSGGFEAAVVILIMSASNWNKCAIDARRRQELPTDDAEAEPSVLGMEESDDEQRSQQPSDSLAIISEESVGLIANNDINGTNEEQSQN